MNNITLQPTQQITPEARVLEEIRVLEAQRKIVLAYKPREALGTGSGDGDNARVFAALLFIVGLLVLIFNWVIALLFFVFCLVFVGLGSQSRGQYNAKAATAIQLRIAQIDHEIANKHRELDRLDRINYQKSL